MRRTSRESWRALPAAALAVLGSSCGVETSDGVVIQRAGDPPTRLGRLQAQAEWLDFTPSRGELRIRLGGREGCEAPSRPRDDEARLVLTVVTPAGAAPTAGAYRWLGRAAHGGTAVAPERPYLEAVLQTQAGPRVVEPGAVVHLEAVDLAPGGHVLGTVELTDPVLQVTAAGQFSARVCGRAPTVAAPSAGPSAARGPGSTQPGASRTGAAAPSSGAPSPPASASRP